MAFNPKFVLLRLCFLPQAFASEAPCRTDMASSHEGMRSSSFRCYIFIETVLPASDTSEWWKYFTAETFCLGSSSLRPAHSEWLQCATWQWVGRRSALRIYSSVRLLSCRQGGVLQSGLTRSVSLSVQETSLAPANDLIMKEQDPQALSKLRTVCSPSWIALDKGPW